MGNVPSRDAIKDSVVIIISEEHYLTYIGGNNLIVSQRILVSFNEANKTTDDYPHS